MVNADEFKDADWPPSQSDAPVQEVLLSELVTADTVDPISAGLLDSSTEGDEQQFLQLKRLTHPLPDVTGGDPDDDWYQAEVVGEEAVGGDNPTPDQNVTEDLLQSAGISGADGESLHTQDKLAQRDRRRWELNPESAQDYGERE